MSVWFWDMTEWRSIPNSIPRDFRRSGLVVYLRPSSDGPPEEPPSKTELGIAGLAGKLVGLATQLMRLADRIEVVRFRE